MRRVATLVARGAPSAEVFDGRRAGGRSGPAPAEWSRSVATTSDGAMMTVIADVGARPDVFAAGITLATRRAGRWSRRCMRTGRPQRVEEYAELPGALAAGAREHGFNASRWRPDHRRRPRLGSDRRRRRRKRRSPIMLEDRLAEFTELVATAIANSQAHDELTRLAEEQAALRRVATLVAAGAPPAEVFEAVSAEVAALIAADGAALTRYEADGTVTAVSGWTTEGGYIYVGRRYELEGTVSGLIFETGRPGRVDELRRSAGRGARGRPRDGLAFVRGSADHRRGPPLGRLGRRLEERAAPAPRYRAATGRVRRALRDRDRKQRGTRAARAARRRTGGAATGGDARRRGGDSAPCVRRRPSTRWHGCSTPHSAC